MSDAEILKAARNDLLKLHKVLLDDERFTYERQHGLLSPTEFLQVLLEDTDFAWLRRFSILIVEIDEMFATKGGYSPDSVPAHLRKIDELLKLQILDDQFVEKYSSALEANDEVATLHAQIDRTLAGV